MTARIMERIVPACPPTTVPGASCANNDVSSWTLPQIDSFKAYPRHLQPILPMHPHSTTCAMISYLSVLRAERCEETTQEAMMNQLAC